VPSLADATLEDARGRLFDLLVIGGGINGAGIARDAALRGLSVCLVEKNDWGWGTSAKSSKLAHGGLRYLEQFEFGLVHEALQDRERLLRQAPHLVRPLRFLYPIYPHVAARRTVRVGLLLYDVLSHGKSVEGRDHHSVEETLRVAPGLEREGLKGGATYTDGQIQHVERLVAELVVDAAAHGALCLNHARVKEILVGPDDAGTERARGAVVVDGKGREATVRSRATVNAAGPWVDDVLGRLGAGRPPKVRKTKGVHVLVPRFLDTAVIVKAASDGRTFFIIPWQEHCIIGTTDTDYTGDPGDAVAEPEDVAYLLEEARRYFPDAPLDEVRYTYAGVRALVNEEGLTESNVTRRHILYDHGRKEGLEGLWTLQGGKITTYRSLAEECVDRVATALGRNDVSKAHPTREGTLPGGPLIDWETYRAAAVRTAQADHGLLPRSAEHLVDTYGARWAQVLSSSREAGAVDGAERVRKGLPHLRAEVDFAVREEGARTLGDVMLRRTTMGLARDGAPEVARSVAARMAGLLGWDRRRLAEERRRYADEAAMFWIDALDPARPLPPAVLGRSVAA